MLYMKTEIILQIYWSAKMIFDVYLCYLHLLYLFLVINRSRDIRVGLNVSDFNLVSCAHYHERLPSLRPGSPNDL